MRSLATLVLSGLAAAALTYAFLRWIEGRQIVAVENHRSMHKGRVPVGGGWPLLLAALATSALLWPVAGVSPWLLGSLATLVLVSWWDDISAVTPVLRLGVHAAASVAAVLTLPPDALVFQGWLPWTVDRAVAALAVAWLINLTNFMDGIDGIAGVETASIGIGYAAVMLAAGGDASTLQFGLALAITGASLGFLIWNWSPARIFLGDVGSVPLGFLAGILMLDLAVRHSLAAAIILPLYFAADATITLVRRLLAGARPWDAHRTHFYQRAAAARGAHAPIVRRVALCNAVLIVAALWALTSPLPAFALACCAVGILLIELTRLSRMTPRYDQ
ncbi:MAG: hypothetical protein ACT4N2_12925 [Hyphomicrobium sp.]